jgi:predicted nuclease of predicted toxin-antitoxin system
LSPSYFFLDRSLECGVVIRALQAAGADVRVHSDYFAHDEDDEVWLPQVARRRWVILTKDKRIRRRPIEKQALLASGARAFVLTSGSLRGEEMADLFVKRLRRMERVARNTNPPFVAAVTRTEVRIVPM